MGQDLEIQKQALLDLGIPEDRIYLDHGLTGTNRNRPELEKALAACWEGSIFTVTKLDRAFRSVPDANEVIQGLSDRGVKFGLGSSVYDWADPFGRMFLQMLAVFAEFEANLIKTRTREGMAKAKAKGKLKGGKPKLSPAQEKHLRELRDSGEYTISDLEEMFRVSRPTVYRALQRTAG